MILLSLAIDTSRKNDSQYLAETIRFCYPSNRHIKSKQFIVVGRDRYDSVDTSNGHINEERFTVNFVVKAHSSQHPCWSHRNDSVYEHLHFCECTSIERRGVGSWQCKNTFHSNILLTNPPSPPPLVLRWLNRREFVVTSWILTSQQLHGSRQDEGDHTNIFVHCSKRQHLCTTGITQPLHVYYIVSTTSPPPPSPTAQTWSQKGTIPVHRELGAITMLMTLKLITDNGRQAGSSSEILLLKL